MRILFLVCFCVVQHVLPLNGQLLGPATAKGFHSCEFRPSGKITITVNQTWALDYPGLQVVEWENLDNGDYGLIEVPLLSSATPTIVLEDMAVGSYEIFIHYEEDCYLLLEPVINSLPTSEIEIYGYTTDPGCSLSNGSIYVGPIGGEPPFVFEWSTGVIEEGNSTYQTELAEGNYCVTVSSADCGIVEDCFIISEPFYPFVSEITVDQLSDCNTSGYSSSADGVIHLDILAGSPITVGWTGPNGYESTGITISTGYHSYRNSVSGLNTSGTYSYIINYGENCETDEEDVVVSCCNDFSDALEVVIDGTWDCQEEMGTVSIEITNGWDPYDIHWSTGESTTSISVSTTNAYSVTVTDARGCSIELSYDFQVVEVLEENAACEGISDGSIIFQINNPNNYPVDIDYDFSACYDCLPFPVIVNETYNPIIVELQDLLGNHEYTFYIYIDDCSIPFTFTLDEEPFERIYSDYRKEGENVICVYDLSCGENYFENGEEALAAIDLNADDCNPSVPGTPCGHVDYLCEGVIVESKEIKKKWMRRAEAQQLARDMDFDELLDIQFHLGGSLCDRVRVCPNNPLCQGTNLTGEFGGRFHHVETLSNGCTRIVCRSLGLFGLFSYTVCGLDYVPEFLLPYYEDGIFLNVNINSVFSTCKPVEKSFAELITFRNLILADPSYPLFEGSELEDFILFYQNDHRAPCAKVRYCSNDFSHVTSNIEEVQCGLTDIYPLTSYETCFPQHPTPNGYYVQCVAPCAIPRQEICAPPDWISTDYSTFNLSGDNGGSPHVALAAMTANTQFAKFALIRQTDDDLSVSGILKSDEETYYLPLLLEKWQPYSFSDLEYVYEYPDSAYMYLIQEDAINPAEHYILFGEFPEPDTALFVSNIDLEIDRVVTHLGQDHYILGTFRGDVSFNGNLLLQSSTTSDYVVHMTQDATVINAFELEILNFFSVPSETYPGKVYQSNGTTSTVRVNGTNYNSIAKGAIMEVDLSDTYEVVTQKLKPGANFRLEQFAYDSTDATKFYLLRGRGTIFYNSTQVYSTSNDRLVLICAKDNQVEWVKELQSSGAFVTDVLLEASNAGEVYLGMHFTDSVIVDLDTFHAVGNTDILILGYDPDGQKLLATQYGSPDNEFVNDLQFSPGVLYLGGELEGATFSRQIGDFTFGQFHDSLSQAYISAIALDTSGSGGQQAIITQTTNPKGNNKVEHLTIFPNPASQSITIMLHNIFEAQTITVYDVLGSPVYTKSLNAFNGAVSHTMDVSNLSQGLYFVTALSESGSTLVSSFIKT